MNTVYLGLCDYCRTAQQFTTAEARDYWEAHHEEHGSDGDTVGMAW